MPWVSETFKASIGWVYYTMELWQIYNIRMIPKVLEVGNYGQWIHSFRGKLLKAANEHKNCIFDTSNIFDVWCVPWSSDVTKFECYYWSRFYKTKSSCTGAFFLKYIELATTNQSSSKYLFQDVFFCELCDLILFLTFLGQ